jgi:hypothetical protein
MGPNTCRWQSSRSREIRARAHKKAVLVVEFLEVTGKIMINAKKYRQRKT